MVSTQKDNAATEEYLQEAAALRRKGLRNVALVLCATALVSGGMASRMSDVGHFAGFAGLGIALLIAAFVVWRSAKS